MNIDKYVTFEDPDATLPNPLDGGVTETKTLHEQDIASIRSVLEEIARTPEGRQLIRDAAANNPDGKINIAGNPGGITGVFQIGDDRHITISGEDADFQYRSPETGEWQDFSVQRMIVEELQHQALGHEGVTLENEAEAKAATNTYMEKYYGEPPEHTGMPTHDTHRFEGTDKWDYNQNFQRRGASAELDLPEGPFDAITATDQEVITDVAEAGIEIDPSQLRTADLGNAAPDLGNNGQDFGIT